MRLVILLVIIFGLCQATEEPTTKIPVLTTKAPGPSPVNWMDQALSMCKDAGIYLQDQAADFRDWVIKRGEEIGLEGVWFYITCLCFITAMIWIVWKCCCCLCCCCCGERRDGDKPTVSRRGSRPRAVYY